MSFPSRPGGSVDDDLSDDAAETVGAATVVGDGAAAADDGIPQIVAGADMVTSGLTDKVSVTELGGVTPTVLPSQRGQNKGEEPDALDEPTNLMTGDQTDQVKLPVPDAARPPKKANTVRRAAVRDTKRNGQVTETRSTEETKPLVAPGVGVPKKMLGGYRVTAVLASGEMGVVYRGEHPTGRRPAVAIKSVQGQLQTNPAIVARFFAESIVLARIDHPNVVRFHDFGYDAEGSAYLVMELLDGETLSKRLSRERRLEISVATDIALQVAQGLAAAHKQGVIHRDIKPDNIFICSNGIVKLLDFGVAKLDGQGPTQTLQGDLLGTAAYMAPEQGRSASDSDARSDLYSVGCILFEMVTGVVPFPGSLVETLVAHQTAERPPARALNAEVSTQLDAIIDKLMARDPAQRPQTAGDVIQALGAFESTIERPRRRGAGSSQTGPTRVSLRIKLGSFVARIRDEPIALGLLIAVIVLLIALLTRH